MAKTQGVIAELDKEFVRGEVAVGASQAQVLRARIVFAYAQAHYPKEVALFVHSLGDIPQSLEDERYLRALIRFTTDLLGQHADDEMLQSISPREMVEEISEQLIRDARMRRAAIRRYAKRLVQQYVRGAPSEQKRTEESLVASIRASIDTAQTPQQLRGALEREAESLSLPPTEVAHELLEADPLSAQRLLFATPARTARVLEQVASLPAPAWRAYATAVESLPMGPEETVGAFIDRAKEVGQAAAFLSADLSQEPATRVSPGGLVAAVLEASGNKTALSAFEKLTEQAKNAVSLAAIARSWENTVDALTKRAGGVIAQSVDPVIREANTHPPSGSTQQVASLVGDILGPILGRTFERLADVHALGSTEGKTVQAAASSAQTLLLLAAYLRDPGGVTFERRGAEGTLEPVGWVVRWAADSVFGRVVDRAAKSEAEGFLGKILQPVLGFFGIRVGGAATKAAAGAAAKVAGEGAKRGIAAVFAKLGLSALAGVFTGGTSLLVQAAAWVGGKVLSWIWRAGARLLSARWLTSLLGFGAAPSAPRRWYEQDWVPIVVIIAVAVLIPMFGATLQITTQNAALVTSFEASAIAAGGPYTETFPAYGGPFPSGPTVVSTCAVDHKHLTQRPFDTGGIGTHERTCAYDFDAPWMSPVVATHDGCVAYVRTHIENGVKEEGSYGNVVVLAGKNADGSTFYSRYAHLAQNTSAHLSVGQCIAAGTPIGSVDNTGHSTGTHLHLEFLDETMGYVTPQQCASLFSLPGCTQ